MYYLYSEPQPQWFGHVPAAQRTWLRGAGGWWLPKHHTQPLVAYATATVARQELQRLAQPGATYGVAYLARYPGSLASVLGTYRLAGSGQLRLLPAAGQPTTVRLPFTMAP